LGLYFRRRVAVADGAQVLLKETTAIRHLCELTYLDHNEQISKLAEQTVAPPPPQL
jgi:hypothetical protein